MEGLGFSALGKANQSSGTRQTCVAELLLPEWPLLPIGQLLTFIQGFAQDVLDQETEPLLRQPAPLGTVLWLQSLHVLAALPLLAEAFGQLKETGRTQG